MAAKLKVFTWSDGFHAFTVAASSRPKALAAWGVDQDLFKTGLAHEIDQGDDREAALAAPGAVISRGLAVDVGKAETRKPKPTNEKAKAKLKALEAELVAMDADQAEAMKALDDRRTEIEAERERLTADQDKARRSLVSNIRTARSSA